MILNSELDMILDRFGQPQVRALDMIMGFQDLVAAHLLISIKIHLDHSRRVLRPAPEDQFHR
jgi:hypothetical protein